MRNPSIRLLIAEDHTVVREGLAALFADVDDVEVVALASSGLQAVELAQRHNPDVVVMDLGLPELNGIEACRRIHANLDGTQIVILTMHDDAPTVDRALQAGARGFVLKGAGLEQLLDAIRTVVSGEVFLNPDISDYILQGYLDSKGPSPDPLTDREREIIQLIADGRTSREIGALLGLKTKTVQNYRARLMEKLSVRTTAGLVRYALRNGFAV